MKNSKEKFSGKKLKFRSYKNKVLEKQIRNKKREKK